MPTRDIKLFSVSDLRLHVRYEAIDATAIRTDALLIITFSYGQLLTINRGVELQLRAQQPLLSNPNSYPHSLDRRIQAGDQFRESKALLESTLNSIERFYSSPEAGPHSGPPSCERCSKQKHDIAKAYYDYYLSNDPRAWFTDYSQYKHEIQRRFENPDIYSLDDINSVFQRALRDHLKQDLCASQPGEPGNITKFKSQTADVFSEGDRSTAEVLTAYLQNIPLLGLNPDAVSFILALQNTSRPEERAPIYIQYYCTPRWNDSPAAKAFKGKYARMFESLAPHDEVLAAMKKEAEGSQASKSAELQVMLSDIKMAQSAHLRNKKRKAEKDQRMIDREPSPRFEQCTLGGCRNEINLSQGQVVECALCEWMDRKGGEKGRAIYCSVEHAEQDFVSLLFLLLISEIS